MKVTNLISVLFSLLVSAFIIGSTNGEVVPLNDVNFEHQTQASTGMTTGSWFVFFKAKRCPHCNKLMKHYKDLANNEEIAEKGILLSTVDVNDSPHVTNRFLIRGFPTLIFLHQKKMYAYNGKREYESMKEFLLGGFDQTTAMNIPPPPGAFEYYVKLFQAIGLELKDAALGKSGATGYAIIALVGLLMSIFGFIIAMFFMPAKKTKND